MNKTRLSLLFCISFLAPLLMAQSMESDVTIIRSEDAANPMLVQRDMVGPGFNVAVNPAMGRGNRVFVTSVSEAGRLYPPKMIMHNQESLNLTPKQVAIIKDEMRKFQSGNVDIQWDLNEARSKLDRELSQDRIDEKRVLALVDSVSKAENDLQKSRLMLLIRIRNVLEPAQLAELEKLPGFHAAGMAMPMPASPAFMR